MKTIPFTKKSEHQIYQDIEDSFTVIPLNIRKCVKSINTFIYNLSMNNISKDTIDNVYFLLLRSFQSKESYIKFIICSCIFEIYKYTDQGFVGINAVIKELDSKEKDFYKSIALRSLFVILPDEMIYDYEKYVNQAFLSKNDARVDSACVISYILLLNNLAHVKKWLPKLDISDDIKGYHKVLILEKMKQNTQLEVLSRLRGTPAILACRIISSKIEESPKYIDYMKNFLNYNLVDEEVFLEACKCVCNMKEEISLQFISQVVSGLRNFLNSDLFHIKFASLRVLNNLSSKFHSEISGINKEIENILKINNKSLTVLAIGILLRTGTEETIDRLIKLVPDYILDMDDDYKKLCINTLLALSESYSSRNQVFFAFISKCLQNKSTLEFKLYLINVLKKYIGKNEMREEILGLLCTYMEDSEYPQVTVEILGVLGDEIPQSETPQRYLLHIFNRLLLEDNYIKASVLQALYTISLRYDFNEGPALIKKYINDEDEMIRELSILLYNNLKNKERFDSCGEFSIDELGDLKHLVFKYVDEAKFVESKEDETNNEVAEIEMIKTCRDILLSDNVSDVKVTLTKKVFADKTILSYKLQNQMEGVQILKGVITLKIKDDLYNIDVSMVRPEEVIVVEKEVKIEEDDVINGAFNYDVCIEDDMSDVETDSIDFIPVQYTIFDSMKPVKILNRPLNKSSIKFTLNKDLLSSSKKILDMLNLKILTQDTNVNSMKLSTSGKYKEIPVIIDININYKTISTCNVDILCDDSELVSRMAKYFE